MTSVPNRDRRLVQGCAALGLVALAGAIILLVVAVILFLRSKPPAPASGIGLAIRLPQQGSRVDVDRVQRVLIQTFPPATVDRLELWVDGELEGILRPSESAEAIAPTVQVAWRPRTTGPHILVARGYDSSGRSGRSQPVVVDAVSTQEPEQVFLTAQLEPGQSLESLAAWWEARPVERWKSRFALGQGTDYRTDRLNSSISSLSNTRNRQASWDNEVRLSPEHVVSLGAEVLRQELVNSAFAQRQDRDVDILRAGYLGRLGRHSAQLNARSEDYSDFGRADTYFAGYGFDLTEAWRLTASAGSAFRAPTFQDLFGFGGDPALKPERARTKELGVQWASGPHRARLVAFDTEYEDAITFDLATFTVRNVRRASVDGVELSYSGVLAGFDLRGSLTSQKAIEQEPNAQPLPAIRRAKAHGAFSAHRSFGRWRLGGEALSSGSRPDNDILTFARVQLAGYTVVNLMARYQFNRHLYVAARLENAFDKEYSLVDGYNTAGRGLFVSIGWRP